MPTPIPSICAKPRRRRKRHQVASTPPLTLVSAQYDTGDLMVTLVFDRPIDISSMDATQITLNDFDYMSLKFICDGGAWQESAESVRLELADGTITHVPGQTITATAMNGIVGADGEAWGGVTDFAVTT